MAPGPELVRKLIGVLAKLHFADSTRIRPARHIPTASLPSPPYWVGKRATRGGMQLAMDLEELDHRPATLQLRGVKGTTGTQASFMELFKGDADKYSVPCMFDCPGDELCTGCGGAGIRPDLQPQGGRDDRMLGWHWPELHEVCRPTCVCWKLQGNTEEPFEARSVLLRCPQAHHRAASASALCSLPDGGRAEPASPP